MDLTETITPKSDQLNADDLMAGPQTVTIVAVRPSTSEQPVDIVTAEFGPKRPFKPSKSMRRVLVAAWGKDSQAYLGQQMTLYRDPTVKFGGDEVGGIRISHMTGLERQMKIALTVTRGKRAPYIVDPLASRNWQAELDGATTREELVALWNEAPATWKGRITEKAQAIPASAAGAEPEQLPDEQVSP